MKYWRAVTGAGLVVAGLLLGQTQPILTKQTKLGCPASATVVQGLVQPVGSATTLVCMVYDPTTFTFNSGTGVLSVVVPATPPGSGPQFADAETPKGTIDGTNAVFTLAFAPSPSLSLQLSRNGVLLKQVTDYTLSGSTVTFNTGVFTIPQAGDILTASYRH